MSFYKYVFLFFISLSLIGCDKIPFLSKYFPSLGQKAEKPAAAAPEASRPAEPAMNPNTLARVGGWTITSEEFNEKLQGVKELVPDFDVTTPESKKLILEELIRQQLLIQEAQDSGITQKKDIIDAVEEFRNTLLIQEIVNKITSGIIVGGQEVQDYYTNNKDSFVEEAEWHIREIMVPTRQEANEILVSLLQGTDFAETAKTRSKAASALEGGDLGFIREFKFPEMEKAVNTLSPGGTSSVTQGPDGFYIFKAEEKKGGQALEFTAVKEDIEKGLNLMKQQEAVLNYIEELKKKISIEKNESLLGG